MVSQELIDKITAKYRAGQRKDLMMQELMEEGWHESEINDAIREIQKNALAQLPFFKTVFNYLKTFDQKTQKLSTRATLILFGIMALLVLLVAFILYMWLDPLNIQGSQRDKQREKDLRVIQQAIMNYYSANQTYPASLQKLVPQNLSTVPLDPKTEEPYQYKILDDQMNYELCIFFEVSSVQCITSTSSSVIPTIFPTPITTQNYQSPAVSQPVVTINPSITPLKSM